MNDREYDDYTEVHESASELAENAAYEEGPDDYEAPERDDLDWENVWELRGFTDSTPEDHGAGGGDPDEGWDR